MCGIYDSVTLSFMIVGHTKFSPDWCFGLLKQRLRRCRVDCLDDIVDVVESSADVNSAQLVGAQSGEILVAHVQLVTILLSHTSEYFLASKLTITFISIPHHQELLY